VHSVHIKGIDRDNSISTKYIFGGLLKTSENFAFYFNRNCGDPANIQRENLENIECGQEQITDIEAQIIITRYGEARTDRLDSLLYEWALEEISRHSKTYRRQHLSLVGE